MLNLFNRNKQLLDEDIIEWIFNCYAWAFEQFDKDVFLSETVLVIPDNKHFPGKETTAEGMANLIFEQVKAYAAMAHWPTRLVDMSQTNEEPQPLQLQVSGSLRGNNAIASFSNPQALTNAMPVSSMPISSMPISSMPQSTMPQNAAPDNRIPFVYHPQQLKNPEGLIAHLAHGLSHHLASVATKRPPGGAEYLPMASELIGIFMGFGLMYANSAKAKHFGGCGSCGQGPARQAFLSEEEATYALALFCQLKGVESRDVTKHLKKHLRGFFKAAVKDCKKRVESDSEAKLVVIGAEIKAD
ncbi:hypothetical protein [Aliikangiella sp. IMCC44359]|uniref:hypothetical protein n=1 Tax=Aliikangiella sp. IMCC44359 TaxID=3459125 RepID=UPI00403ACAFB